METSHKCIRCFFRQAETTSSLIKLAPHKKRKLHSLLKKKLLQFDPRQPPVVFGRTIYKNISSVSGIKDIFHKEKIRIEKHLLTYINSIEQSLQNTKDPLYAAAKMCCSANAIDFGAGHTPNVEMLISRMKKIQLRVNNFSEFRAALRTAKTILIIADNCGEALFDRLFIEQLLRYSPRLQIFYATRARPIINDVLVSDAKRMGIHKIATVLSSGCDYPGIIIRHTSSRFKKIYGRADIIISKGQGNFESLYDPLKNIFYLFKIKCKTVSEYLSLPASSVLFLHNRSVAYPASYTRHTSHTSLPNRNRNEKLL